jgi:hypothetical protein
MMTKLKLCFILIIVLAMYSLQGTESQDGPFGLCMGMSYKELKAIDPHIRKAAGVKNGYLMTVVPKPHSGFKEYIVVIHEKEGLCKIEAKGIRINTDIYGSGLTREYDKCQESITKIYGKCDAIESITSPDTWNPQDYWMMTLYYGDRTHASIWNTKAGSTMKKNVQRIRLDAKAIDSSNGYLLLIYEFDNVFSKLEKQKDEEDGVF